MYCNVCNLFPPTLVIANHTGNNVGAYDWPHLSTIVPQIYHVTTHKQCSWVTLACHVVSTDPSVKVPELSNLIEQAATANIPQFQSNHGWRQFFSSPFWFHKVQSTPVETSEPSKYAKVLGPFKGLYHKLYLKYPSKISSASKWGYCNTGKLAYYYNNNEGWYYIYSLTL